MAASVPGLKGTHMSETAAVREYLGSKVINMVFFSRFPFKKYMKESGCASAGLDQNNTTSASATSSIDAVSAPQP